MNKDRYTTLVDKIEEQFGLTFDDLDTSMENLDLDSLTKAELAFLIEDELDITLDDEVLRNATSVGSLLEKIPGVKD